MEKKYNLPELDYKYNALEPYISEEQLKIHHQKHHMAYVDNANKILEEISQSRKDGSQIDMKSKLKFLSFNLGGHILHEIFWKIMTPEKEKRELKGDFLFEIENEFKSVERFKEEFSKTALSVEGSGWGVLLYEKRLGKLMIGQIEKHNLFLYPNSEIIMALDVWEHTYYLDYKNDRAKFIDNFWQVINWEKVGENFNKAKEGK
ncbi:MAG: superoxide dismutase [Candidatus Pacebacteria bacterium]|nr:superoxide dismutase [Candidatus Paceibacterota bacterium]